MHLLAAATQSGQPDYVALLMVAALAIVVAIMALRKRFGTKKTVQEEAPAPQAAEPAAPQIPAPGSAGELKLHDVEPKTAAMLIAITADKLGKPLNELRFISVEEVK